MGKIRYLRHCLVLLLTGVSFSSFAQTASLSISNQYISGGYLYFDINLTRTSAWAADFLGDCSFYFTYNSSALSSATLTYTDSNINAGNGFVVSSGNDASNVYVTINYSFPGSSWSPSLNTQYKLFTVRLTITNPGETSQLAWDTGNSSVLDATDASITESYSGDGDISLPVQLFSFSAEPMDGGVMLRWTTQSETDNVGFILERSVDAGAGWSEIASYQSADELKGQGNTSASTDYAFWDEEAPFGQMVRYRLSDVSSTGEIRVYDPIEITLDAQPGATVLKPTFPNPCNPMTKVSYELDKKAEVRLVVYDLLGRKVKTLVAEPKSIGRYDLYWYADDESGQKVASGMYMIVLNAGKTVKTQKVTVVR